MLTRRDCLVVGMSGFGTMAAGLPVLAAAEALTEGDGVAAPNWSVKPPPWPEVGWDERGRWYCSGEEPLRLWRRGCWVDPSEWGPMFCHQAVPLDADVAWDLGPRGSVRRALFRWNGGRRVAGPKRPLRDLWRFMVTLDRHPDPTSGVRLAVVRARFTSASPIVVSQADHGIDGAMALAEMLTQGFDVPLRPMLQRI